MKSYLVSKHSVVVVVGRQLPDLKPDSQWTMTITQEKSGACYVLTVTAESSEDTELQTARFFSETQVTT